MTWTFTGDVEEYAAAALPLLASDPAHFTVALTSLAQVRSARAAVPGRWAWWTEQGEVRGAAALTPPFAVDLAQVPEVALPALLDGLATGEPQPDAFFGPTGVAVQAAALWTARHGGRAVLRMAQRLHVLDTLLPPADPGGAARTATEADTDLVTGWLGDFVDEAGTERHDLRGLATYRIVDGGVLIWEDDAGEPVAMASRNRIVAGMARVGPVWTVVPQRRRGYAAAVTAAVTEASLAAGATTAVLFTDLTNPTSNGIYRRLGYRPVGDRASLALEPAGAAQRP